MQPPKLDTNTNTKISNRDGATGGTGGNGPPPHSSKRSFL